MLSPESLLPVIQRGVRRLLVILERSAAQLLARGGYMDLVVAVTDAANGEQQLRGAIAAAGFSDAMASRLAESPPNHENNMCSEVRDNPGRAGIREPKGA